MQYMNFGYKILENINTPFKALYLEKKIISLLAKFKFKEDSLIRLVSSLLGMTDIENARARQKVAKK